MMSKKVCIFGAGESAKSVYQLICGLGCQTDIEAFIETTEDFTERQIYGVTVKPREYFDATKHHALLAIGMPAIRAAVARSLPAETQFASYVHPNAFKLLPSELKIGAGSVVFPHVYFSRNITIGAHAIIMPGTIIGHDINIGNFLTTSANVSFGGGVTLGDEVFCGLGVAIRDHISICDQVVLGMSAAVTSSISSPGTYVGNPAKIVRRKIEPAAVTQSVAAIL